MCKGLSLNIFLSSLQKAINFKKNRKIKIKNMLRRKEQEKEDKEISSKLHGDKCLNCWLIIILGVNSFWVFLLFKKEKER